MRIPHSDDFPVIIGSIILCNSLRELHKKDDPIVKWFDKGFPQTTLANGEVD